MGAPLGPRAGSQHLLGVAALLAVGCLLAFRRGDAFCAPRSATLFIGQERGGSDGPRAAGGGGDGGAWVLAHNKAPAAAAAATAACPTAEDVAASPWARSCYHLTKVCVDQGTLILHDDAYQPAPKGGGGSEPPSFAAEGGYGQYIYTYRNGYGKYKYPLAGIRSRPVSQNEGTDYLAAPSFSACTVPVVFYPFWMTNFGHFLRDNAAKLWGLVQDVPWGDSIKFVPVTAEGLALPRFNYQLLQPTTPLRVETWADFTTRLPPGFAGLVPPGPPPSAEGEHQRCFENLLVCTHGLNITRWPLHSFGRRVVQAYRHLLDPEVAALAATDSAVRSRSGGGSSGRDSEPTVLNVVFQKRGGDTRQMLNIGELLEWCNGWEYTTADGRRLRAKCWEFEITDLVSGLTAANTADVMVGMHGANLANGWLMRPGSSMIEVQAFGFDEHIPHLQDPLFNHEDKESEVLWWVLMGCDPDAWRPSPAEAARKADPGSWVKNRSMYVRWEALEAALRQLAETGGNMQRYWELWDKGQWWWHVRADSVVHGGHHRNKCANTVAA